MVEPAGKRKISFGQRSAEKVNLMPFPDQRTYRWVPIEAADSARSDLPIVISQEVLVAVNQCVAVSLEREIGGYLLGNVYRDPNASRERDFVVIDQYSPAQFTESTAVSLSFTQEAWAKLSDELSGKFLGKTLVGWYHSHPKMGIFLSQWDIVMHGQRFADRWMSALVMDPQKETGGFFAQRNGNVDPRTPVEFYELREEVGGRMQETSVMGWNGYLCRHPVTNEEIRPRIERPVAAAVVAAPESRSAAQAVAKAAPPAKRGMGLMIGVAAAIVVVLALVGRALVGGRSVPVADIGFKQVKYATPGDVERGVLIDMTVSSPPTQMEVRVEGEPAEFRTMENTGGGLLLQVTAQSASVLKRLRELSGPSSQQSLDVEVIDKATSKAVGHAPYLLTYAALNPTPDRPPQQVASAQPDAAERRRVQAAEEERRRGEERLRKLEENLRNTNAAELERMKREVDETKQRLADEARVEAARAEAARQEAARATEAARLREEQARLAANRPPVAPAPVPSPPPVASAPPPARNTAPPPAVADPGRGGATAISRGGPASPPPATPPSVNLTNLAAQVEALAKSGSSCHSSISLSLKDECRSTLPPRVREIHEAIALAKYSNSDLDEEVNDWLNKPSYGKWRGVRQQLEKAAKRMRDSSLRPQHPGELGR